MKKKKKNLFRIALELEVFMFFRTFSQFWLYAATRITLMKIKFINWTFDTVDIVNISDDRKII